MDLMSINPILAAAALKSRIAMECYSWTVLVEVNTHAENLLIVEMVAIFFNHYLLVIKNATEKLFS